MHANAAYPSSEDPLPYIRSPFITGFVGPNPSCHPSPCGYLSKCPYIITFVVLSELDG